MRRRMWLAVLIAVVFLSGCPAPGVPSPMALRIVHVNDVHSHLDEASLDLTFDGATVRVSAGGYPRIAAKIKAEAARSENVLLLNAGDALQGTLYYTLFNGDADAAMMNGIAWDAFVLGNHEFDDGDAALARFLGQLNAPVLAANVIAPRGDPLEGRWRPSIVKRFGGEAVGVIGLDIARATERSSRPGPGVRFLDEAETVQRYVDLLEAEGISKIILLSHLGYGMDLNLSRHVAGIDVIVGGHSHTLMGAFSALGLTPEAPYPVRATSSRGEPVCIVQAWSYARVVGSLDVVFDRRGVVTGCEGTPVLAVGDRFTRRDAEGNFTELNASERAAILARIAADPVIEVVSPEPGAQGILARYKGQVDARKAQIVGVAGTELRHIRVPGRDYLGNSGNDLPLGSEIAPVVAKAFYERVADADLCILNAGGVRANLEAGPISVDTAYTLLPFSDTLFTLSMRGEEIRRVLEEAVVSSGESDGAFPYAYGIRYDVDMNAPPGARVRNLEGLDRAAGTWARLGDKMMYTVVTISYLAAGKDGYETFKTVQAERGKGTDTYLDYAMSFVDYVRGLRAEGKKVARLPAAEGCIKSFRE